MRTLTAPVLVWSRIVAASLLVALVVAPLGCGGLSAPPEEESEHLKLVGNRLWFSINEPPGPKPSNVEQVAQYLVQTIGVEYFKCPPDGKTIYLNPDIEAWRSNPLDEIMLYCQLEESGENAYLLFHGVDGALMSGEPPAWSEDAVAPAEW